LALSLSTTQAPEIEDRSENAQWKSPVKVKAFVVAKDVYCGRANSIANYFELNRYVGFMSSFFVLFQTSLFFRGGIFKPN
jgi:hypothetical protein